MKIIQILPALNSGGVERGVVDIANHLAANGHHSFIASSGGKMLSQLHDNVQHFELPLHSKNPLIIWQNYQKLCKIITENQIDIVHARSRAPAWSAYYAAQKTGARFITTYHGAYSANSKFKKKYNSVMAKGQPTIAVSNYIAQHIQQKYPQAEIEVIHRGIDLQHFSPENADYEIASEFRRIFAGGEDKPILLLVGRITRLKGHLLLLEAVKNMAVRVVFIGDENENSTYPQQVREACGDNILILPATQHIREAYLAADLVISATTRPESFGRVAAEAGAMGKIVIASNHGGSLEVIADGVSGFLFENENAKDLARVINAAISMSDERWQHMAEAARKRITENFSLEKMLARNMEIYNS